VEHIYKDPIKRLSQELPQKFAWKIRKMMKLVNLIHIRLR
jgi:hypothetical protein